MLPKTLIYAVIVLSGGLLGAVWTRSFRKRELFLSLFAQKLHLLAASLRYDARPGQEMFADLAKDGDETARFFAAVAEEMEKGLSLEDAWQKSASQNGRKLLPAMQASDLALISRLSHIWLLQDARALGTALEQQAEQLIRRSTQAGEKAVRYGRIGTTCGLLAGCLLVLLLL